MPHSFAVFGGGAYHIGKFFITFCTLADIARIDAVFRQSLRTKRDRVGVNNYSEIINYENNLSSPFEEKENKNTLVNTPKTNIPKDKRICRKLNTEILALIINEELDNREEAIKHIENMPGVKINRIRKNQISVKCDF